MRGKYSHASNYIFSILFLAVVNFLSFLRLMRIRRSRRAHSRVCTFLSKQYKPFSVLVRTRVAVQFMIYEI